MPTDTVLIALIVAGIVLVGLYVVYGGRSSAPAPAKARRALPRGDGQSGKPAADPGKVARESDKASRATDKASRATDKASRATDSAPERDHAAQPEAGPAKAAGPQPLTALDDDSEADPEITMMGRVPDELLQMLRGKAEAPKGEVVKPEEEEVDVDVAVDELVDEETEEEKTGAHALILVVGVARSDRGRHRMCNEDAFLIMKEEPLFVVADGMGGHNAGEVASQKAVDAIEECFRTNTFSGKSHPEWPRRGDELVRSIHHANKSVHTLAQTEERLNGMGTTVVAVRFSPNKQRAYIAHVGDSRCYRIRNGELHQLTEDHTLGRLMGAKGKAARHLAQAVGVRLEVAVDLTIDEPQPGDYYLVCSDGLTKMVPDEVILPIAVDAEDLEVTAKRLIQEANDRGGRDNITVIIIRIEHPTVLAQSMLADQAEGAPASA